MNHTQSHKETPETDAAWSATVTWCNSRDEYPDPHHVALANLAAKLERKPQRIQETIGRKAER